MIKDVAVVEDSAKVAATLTAQYRKAVGGLWEVVTFGAMMLHVETSLTRETRQGCIQSGDTLKGWIEAHCPEINYKTAMRFRALAVALHHEVQIGAKADMVRILTAPDPDLTPKELSWRRRIYDFLEGRSQRQLLLALDCGRAGAPAGNQNAAKPGFDAGLDEYGRKVLKRIEDSLAALERIASEPALFSTIEEILVESVAVRAADIAGKLAAIAKARRRRA